MMTSELRARFARLGPIRVIDRFESGSPATVAIAMGPELAKTNVIHGVFALYKRGTTMLKAKRALEAALAGEQAVLDVPVVEDMHALAQDLRDNGFEMSDMTPREVDVKQLRERLGVTQEQFALRYGLELDALRNWEHGRREPDRAAKSYLSVIAREPERVQRALAVPVLHSAAV